MRREAAGRLAIRLGAARAAQLVTIVTVAGEPRERKVEKRNEINNFIIN